MDRQPVVSGSCNSFLRTCYRSLPLVYLLVRSLVCLSVLSCSCSIYILLTGAQLSTPRCLESCNTHFCSPLLFFIIRFLSCFHFVYVFPKNFIISATHTHTWVLLAAAFDIHLIGGSVQSYSSVCLVFRFTSVTFLTEGVFIIVVYFLYVYISEHSRVWGSYIFYLFLPS